MKAIKEKVLLLLLGGIAFGYSYTPGRQWKIIKGVVKEWSNINQRILKQEIKNLYKSKLISKKENSDGSYTLFLTNKGRIKAFTYHFQNMEIDRRNWDNKWRMVIFDIPEKVKKARDALRRKLKELGFYELQKSVFVLPYECKNEIEFLVEFFQIKKYVRFGTLASIDNEEHLKEIFQLG